ncbi:MAG: zinc-ribbon domain-containing protein [Geobacteraceae bacterium]|nr:zinc-ribbon domain-containing protein [Geobacteraceae bacterium]
MRIECPECKLSGNIDDSTVPATGLAMICPRCKKHFTAEKVVAQGANAAAMIDTCPKCQYATFTEEKFAICPKCGLVVADYHRALLASRSAPKTRTVSPPQRQMTDQPIPPPRLTAEELLKEENARKKYGFDKVPGVVEVVEAPVAAARPSVELPLPVLAAGWGTIVASVFLIVFGVNGVMEYMAKMKEAKAAIEAFEAAQSDLSIFMQFLLFPAVSIVFSLVLPVVAIQFMRMRKWTVTALYRAAWATAALIAVMKLSDLIFHFKRAASDSSFSYYALGTFSEMMMMVLLIAPFIVLAEFLHSEHFEKTEKLFF